MSMNCPRPLLSLAKSAARIPIAAYIPQVISAARVIVVESNRSFVAIRREIVSGFAAHKRRTPSSRLVAGSRSLHLDHLRAKISEQHGAIRSGERLRHFHDANRIENCFHGGDYN